VLSNEDRWAISDVVSLYCYVNDERQFTRLDEIFTEDVVYDLSPFGSPLIHGISGVLDYWSEERRHPVAHHPTALIVHEMSDGVVRAVWKGIGVGHKARVGSATYYNEIVRTSAGWRISRCAVHMRHSGMTIDRTVFADFLPPGFQLPA